MTEDRILLRRAAAEFLGVSVRTVQNLQAAGHLKPIQVTERLIGYRYSNLVRYLSELNAKGKP